MESDSSSGWQGKGALEELMRERIRTTIESIVDEELEASLGAARWQRSGPVRAGYRHGKRSRTLTTSLGPTTIAMPRARLEGEDGRRRKWRSAIIPRYQRRTERVDEAFLGVELTRFRGVCLAGRARRRADAKNPSTIPGRVSAADGRTGARRADAEGVSA